MLFYLGSQKRFRRRGLGYFTRRVGRGSVGEVQVVLAGESGDVHVVLPGESGEDCVFLPGETGEVQ